jgi:tetratricopeptide (TPR) repeat protein
MRLLILFLAAAQALHLDVTDARGKKPSGVAIEAGDADADNWRKLTIARAKKDSVIVWPFDALAAEPDGPGAVQVVVIERGDLKALANPRIAADIATGIVLGRESLEDAAKRTGFDVAALKSAITSLASASDDYAGGAGLLWNNQPARAHDLLARALRERERQLTRVPSDIFPAAMLDARALFDSGKYDDAAAVYLKAMKLRPSDPSVRKARAEALTRAGKEDAARELLEGPK